MKPQATGPTIPRWQLARELERLRIEASFDQREAAEALGCSISKIKNIESGTQSIALAELEKLLNMYGLAEGPEWDGLLEFQRLGKQRGWWTKIGSLSAAVSQYLILEESANSISAYDSSLVHGLLQTEDYARAILSTWDWSEDEMEKMLRVRMARRERLLEREDIPTLNFIFSEAALCHPVGGPDVMTKQLQRLLDEAAVHPIRILPFDVGAHVGLGGSFTIFEFEQSLHSPVVYVESLAGNLFMEKLEEVERCSLAFERLSALALSPSESTQRIQQTINHLEARNNNEV